MIKSQGDNDAEMLQLAAVGVAMSNAKPKAKEAADIIIQVPRYNIVVGIRPLKNSAMNYNYFRFSCQWTNDEDGVAMQLRKMKDDGAFDFQTRG